MCLVHVCACATVTQQLKQAPGEKETNLMPPTCTHALIYTHIMNHGSHLGGKCPQCLQRTVRLTHVKNVGVMTCEHVCVLPHGTLTPLNGSALVPGGAGERPV